MHDTITARQAFDAEANARGSAVVKGLDEALSPRARNLLVMGAALASTGRPVFSGVSASVKAKRREVGKRQRAARRAAR